MPPRRTTSTGYQKARQLRKELTPAERKLWSALRGDQLGVSFRRQHAIGPYIADFCCIKKKLIKVIRRLTSRAAMPAVGPARASGRRPVFLIKCRQG
jgi:hypothetical protein